MATLRIAASHVFPPIAALLIACGGAPFTVAEQTASLDVAGDAGPASDEPGQVAQQVSDPPDVQTPKAPDAAPEAAPAALCTVSQCSNACPSGSPRCCTGTDITPGVPGSTTGGACGCSTAGVCGLQGSPTPPLPCSQTCSGCCDANEVCQAGTSVSACGAGGVLCFSCSSGETCSGNCQPAAPQLDAAAEAQAATITCTQGNGSSPPTILSCPSVVPSGAAGCCHYSNASGVEVVSCGALYTNPNGTTICA